MVKIVNAARPKGQREEYRFFKETESGQEFKSLAETGVAGNDPVLKVSVSQVDADGNAMVDADGIAIVAWHSHTFTPVELENPAFNAEERLAAILTTSIGAYQVAKKSREKVDALKAAWGGAKALKLTVPPTIAVETLNTKRSDL